MPGLGINSHVVLERLPNELILRSEAIPKAQLGRLEPRRLPNAAPRFDSLARDPIPTLRAIHAAMEEYDRTAWEAKVASLVGFEREEAERDRRAFRGEIEEFAAGIALLEDARYPLVLRAFKLMNEVMGEVAATSRSPYSEWRLFQVVFIVSQLRILASREYPELSSPDSDRVDLLWFAAGGGKTEAFLGLIIWHAFFDRLRGKRVGVTALVRFPLRLLTFQQLQRLGRALGVAEKIRKREGIAPGRISLGYFVGGTLTDNRIRKETHERYVNQGLTDRHKQVFQCPFCQGPTTVRYEASLRLIEHHCARQAACPGGAERLPVYVVDDDLYCYLPTVIVSTVDKLAALGQNQRFANLLGRFDMVCPLHGASFLDSNGERCDAARERQSGDRPERCGKRGPRVLYGPFHDPGPALLIQDELHLLSEELGTFDAHYETAVAEMCRSFGMRPWKVIGATATIKDFGHHAYELYLKRGPRQFPSPGPEADESFYYVLNPQRIGRIFLGLLGVARKHTPAVTRALSIIYLELEAARALAQRDPDAACAAYDTDRMTAEEWRRLLFLYELPVTYALTRKGSDQVAEAIESRVKKELLDLAPGYGNVVMQMFNGGVDVAEMIEVMEAIREAQPDGDPATRIRGLVTTNIIGHGVDIARFNIMVFAGFPRLVAEYIQASARVGRTYPGISIFLPTPQSERDRGVFNRFAKFHEYLDRLVDPAAITRWPLPALERTVPGILAGYLMGVASAQVGCLLPTVERVKRALGQPGAEALTTEAMTAWMRRAYGAELAPSAERYRVRLEATAKRRYFSIINAPETTGRPKPVNTHLGAMRSLRDVDEPADICVERDVDRRILRSLIRGRP